MKSEPHDDTTGVATWAVKVSPGRLESVPRGRSSRAVNRVPELTVHGASQTLGSLGRTTAAPPSAGGGADSPKDTPQLASPAANRRNNRFDMARALPVIILVFEGRDVVRKPGIMTTERRAVAIGQA
jgi:hypothetical protein